MDEIKLPPDASEDKIAATAKQLRRMNYSPVLLIPTPGFLTMRAEDVRKQQLRVAGLTQRQLEDAGMPADADVKKFKDDHLRLLAHHFLLLARLRLDQPEAWDEVNELYEDD